MRWQTVALRLREQQHSPVCAHAIQGTGVAKELIGWRPHLGVWVVAPPVWPDASLATQVPDLELDVLVGHCLHIEANGCSRHIPESSCRVSNQPLHRAWRVSSCLLASCMFLGSCQGIMVAVGSLGIVETTSPTCSLSAVRSNGLQAMSWHRGLQQSCMSFLAACIKGCDSQRMVVLPALSRPNTNILASLSPKMDINRDIQMPILSRRSDHSANGLLFLDLVSAPSGTVYYCHAENSVVLFASVHLP